jgi:hypothetical protein
MQIIPRKAGRVGRDWIPLHSLNHTLADTTTFFDRKNRMLRRSFDSFDGNPHTGTLRQFEWGFRPKSAVLKNRVQQFHHFPVSRPAPPVANGASQRSVRSRSLGNPEPDFDLTA